MHGIANDEDAASITRGVDAGFSIPAIIKDCIMRKLLLVTALGLGAASLSASSQAADTGFYARANVGQTDLGGSTFYGEDSDIGLGLTVGWRFIPWLSVEAGYSQLGEHDYDCGGEVCPAVVLPPIKLDSIELGLAACVPFGDSGWFGQARLGMHRWDMDIEGVDNLSGDSDNDLYYGIGAGYQFNERFNLSLNLDRYELDNVESDVDRIGLGFEVAF